MSKALTSKNRTLTILLASTLLDYMGAGIIVPLLPFYAQSFGATPFIVGILMGLLPLMSIFAPMLWGSLSDRIGRRPALLFNIAGTTLAFLGLGLADSISMLFMARLLGGASSASITIAISYVSDLSTAENRTKLLGYLDAAAGIGFVIGPAIGGILVGNDPVNANFHLPGLTAAVVSGLTFCLAFVTLPQLGREIPSAIPPKSSPSLQGFMTDTQKIVQRPLIGMLIILLCILIFATTGVQAIFALWCEQRFGWGAQQFGYLVIFYCSLIAITQIGFTGRLARWIGEVKLLFWSIIAATFGMLLLPFSTTVLQLLGAMLFLAFASANGTPAFNSLLSRLSGAKQQVKTMGFVQSMSGLASFLGSVTSGFLFGSLGANWPYWMGATLLAISAVFAHLNITQSDLSAVMRRRRQKKLMHLFDLLDHDKSGILELRDFQQAGQDFARLRGWEPDDHEYELVQTSFVEFGKILQTLADRDGNHQIDRAEWSQALDKQVDYDFANLFLKIIDTNQDGQVTIEELSSFYQAYGINIEELEEAFHILDLNQDGHISEEEFSTVFTQFLYSDDVQLPGNWLFGTSLPRQL